MKIYTVKAITALLQTLVIDLSVNADKFSCSYLCSVKHLVK